MLLIRPVPPMRLPALLLLVLGLAPALAGCVGGTLAPVLPGARVATSTGDAGRAAQIISAYRAAQGLGPVTVDGRLNGAAESQAREVAGTGSLSHGDFAGRMARFGVRGTAAENLAAGSSDVSEVIVRWEGSPGHNVNLLLPGARRIGFARADSPGSGWGRYWALVIAQ